MLRLMLSSLIGLTLLPVAFCFAQTPLSSITAATASNTIANGNNTGQVWNWANTTNSTSAFTLGETSAATNGTSTSGVPNQVLFKVTTLSNSTEAPISVYARGSHVFSVPPAGGQILATDGTVHAPTFAFASDTRSGMYLGSYGTLSFAVGDATVANMTSQYMQVLPGGSQAPSLTDTFFQNAGFFWGVGSGRVGIRGTTHFSSVTAPTIGACGTSPSVAGTDNAMYVTVGTGGTATSCTVNFGSNFNTYGPICVAQSDTDTAAFKITSQYTSVTVTAATAFTASSHLNILCFGRI